MKPTEVRYLEKIVVQGEWPEALELPLRIEVGVLSRWGRRDGFKRAGRGDVSLSLITRGSAEFEQDGRVGRVMQGQVFLAHKGATQSLRSGRAGYLHKRSLILAGPLLEVLVAAMRLKDVDVVTPRSPGRIRALFRQAYGCLKGKPADLPKRLSALAWEILLECREGLSSHYPPGLRQAMDHIITNLDQPLSAAAIAAQAGLSVRQCARLFKAHLGCSPLAFCTTQRMTVARNLILHSDASIKEIAASVGFADQLYFSSRFRALFGRAPSDYRKRAGRA